MRKNAEPPAAGFIPAAFRWPLWPWVGVAGGTVLLSVVLTLSSRRFGYGFEVIDMPCLLLAGVLVSAGAAFAICVPRFVRESQRSPVASRHLMLVLVILAGLAARLLLFASEPMLEDDYHRYLWDGAVTASGYNPYALSPLSVMEHAGAGPLGGLAVEAQTLLSRINHKSSTTIYPPVAQGAFALAHLIQPWSLTAWRGVLLAFDLATLALLFVLLDATGRSRLWSALYWLNPVVLKEIFNSAHMEAVIFPFALLALLLSFRQRPMWASVALGIAAGAKFWPALLFPLISRPLWGDRIRLASQATIFTALAGLWATPMVIYGVDDNTGVLAYLDRWQTNSALFPTLVDGLARLQSWLVSDPPQAGSLARMVIAVALMFLAIAAARRPIDGPADLVGRSSVIAAALVLLSPAQYPWYTLWMAPFLAFRPYRAFLVLTALIPLYYTLFHFAARETAEIFNSYIVWLIWVPVWTALLGDIWMGQRRSVPSLPLRTHEEANA